MDPIQHPVQHRQASLGQVLRIDLAAMPGAGLLWRAPAAPVGCSLVEVDPGAVPGSAAGIGGERLQRFELTCPTSGTRQLVFELLRPWETEVRAVQPITVTVR